MMGDVLRLKGQRTVLYGLMLCVILAGFALRLHSLSFEASFSVDETTIITRSQHTVPEIWVLTNRTPVQALWLHVWAVDAGLGYGEFPMYFTSVFVGMLAIAVVYRLGKSLFGRWVGLLSAFVLSFSAYHIYWSRSIRYYGWVVVLSAAAFLCLYQAVAVNKPRAWLGYALFRTLSLYVHLSVLTIWAGEAVLVLAVLALAGLRKLWPLQKGSLPRLRRRAVAWRQVGHAWRSSLSSRLFRFAMAMAIIFALFAPRAYYIARNAYEGISGLRVAGLASEETAEGEPTALDLLSVDLQSPFTIMRLFDAWVTPLHAIMLSGFGFGLLYCLLERRWWQALLVCAIIVTPFVLLASVDYQKPVNSRYLISLLPLYVVMASRGIHGLAITVARASRMLASRRSLIGWSVLAAFAAAFVGLNAPRIGLTRCNVLQNWSGVGRFLTQVAQPGQLIIADHESHAVVLQRYLPEHEVMLPGELVALETLYERSVGLWLFSIAKETHETYQEQAYALNPNYVEFVFRGGWHPDMDQTTDLRYAYSWDLSVSYVSPTIASPEEALALYEAWMPSAEPDHLRYHLTWARAYQRLGRPDQAISEYSMALGEGYVNDQLASHILDSRGTCWRELGQAERAIADWVKAIARADWSQQPYQHLAEAYVQTGQDDAAIAIGQSAIAANPGEAWPHVLLGSTYQLSGLDQRAVSEYRTAIEIQPTNQAAHRLLGRLYAKAGNGQVVLLYREAMRRYPSAAWPHLLLGQYYQGMGKIAEAMTEYQRAVELEPNYEPQVSGLLRSGRWDLEAMLGTVAAYSDRETLLWLPNHTWVKPYPSEGTVLVGHSTLAVQGQIQPHQLLIHPFGDKERTYVRFQMPHNPFANLHVGYGLADKTVGLSNGVEYLIEVRRKGDVEYEPLFSQSVTENVWQELTMPLARYWGDDLDFRLAVDARGEYAYDWLQTTIELCPPSDVIWDLSANLDEARFQPDTPPLEWRNDGLYSADGGHLLGRSELLVGGEKLPDQVHFHPYDSDIDSTIVFTLPHQIYHSLKTSFALADDAVLGSNGVDYIVSVRVDSQEMFTDLIHTTVTTNSWNSVLVDLPPTQNLVLKLTASARHDVTFDWLQVRLALLPFGDDQEQPQATMKAEQVRESQRFLDYEANTDDH